jgi:hypothetical protein
MYVGPEIRGGKGRRPRRAKQKLGLVCGPPLTTLIWLPSHIWAYTFEAMEPHQIRVGEVLREQAFLYTYSFSDMNILFCFMFPFCFASLQ